MSLEQTIQRNNELLEALNANFTRLLAFAATPMEVPQHSLPAKPAKAIKKEEAPKAPAFIEKEVAAENAKAATAVIPADQPTEATLSYDTVKGYVLAAVKEKGRDAVVAVLDTFGVQRVDQLAKEQYADLLAALKAL